MKSGVTMVKLRMRKEALYIFSSNTLLITVTPVKAYNPATGNSKDKRVVKQFVKI